MKVLAVMGCSRFGNTTELAKYFADRLTEFTGAEIEFLYLYDYKIEYCVGCHNCILLGEKKCPHYHTVSRIEQKMMESDAVILASPGYMFSVTGVMKAFLDHVAYNCHRPKYFGKKMILLGNFTKWQKKGVFIPMETWASGAGFEICGRFHTDMLPFPLKKSSLDRKKRQIEKAAEKTGRRLLVTKPRKLRFGDVAIYHSFRTLCRIAPDILQADYEYFRERDAFDKKTKWYVPVKVPFLYSLLGGFIAKMVQRQVGDITDKEKLADIKGRYVTRLLG